MPTVPPKTHINRLSGGQLRTIAACVARVLWDSTKTEDIVTTEEMTAQDQLRHLLALGVFETDEGRQLLADRPNLGGMDLAMLRTLPPESFGAAVARFFDDNGLDTGLYGIPAKHTQDETAAFLMRRIRYSHDLWHVLMGFTIDGHEEILLHAFSLAQTGLPSSIALMTLGSLKHMLLEGRFGCIRTGLSEAFERGRRAEPLLGVYWEQYWSTPLDEVRQRFGIEPWTEQDRAATRPWALRGPRRTSGSLYQAA